MYPNLYYAVKDLFGKEWTALRFINSFGFFVALAFVAAALVLTHELKRKSKLGLLQYEEARITVGEPASIAELLMNFLTSLHFLWREPNPQAFLFHAVIELLSKFLIFRAVADEARVELGGLHRAKERREVLDVWLRNTTAAQEYHGNLAT